MPAPQPPVDITTSAYRKGTDRLVVVNTVKRTRGGYPFNVVHYGPLLIQKGIFQLVYSNYDNKTGRFVNEYEIQKTHDPDDLREFEISGEIFVAGEEGVKVYHEKFKLGAEEEAPVAEVLKGTLVDNILTLKVKVRRQNGKISRHAEVTQHESYRKIGIECLISSEYDRLTGVVTAKFKAEPSVKIASINMRAAVKITEAKTLSEINFEEHITSVRSISYSVLSTTLKGKGLSVVIKPRYTDTLEVPKSFSLKSPFISGTFVPSGVVNASDAVYNKDNGTYEFSVKVETIKRGKLHHHFNAIALADDYPEYEMDIEVVYDHQNSFTMDVKSITLSNGKLTARLKVNALQQLSYQLENFSLDSAALAVGVIGNLKPMAKYYVSDAEIDVTWDVHEDTTKEMRYDIRGHFVIDDVPVPYVVKCVVKPVTVWNESIGRIDGLFSGYKFLVLTDDKVKDVDCSGLQVLLDRNMSGLRVTQHTNEEPGIVSGHFELTPPTDDAVEVEVLGSVTVVTDIIHKLPVHIKGIDYIPFPQTGSEMDIQVHEHSLIGSVEKLVLVPRFVNNTAPVNLTLVTDSLTVNGEPIKPAKVVWRNGYLSILMDGRPAEKRETRKVAGKFTLPGYQGGEQYEFSSERTFGSDTFPAELVLKDVVYLDKHLVSTISILLKDGSIPESVEFVKMVNDRGIGNTSFQYDNESGTAILTSVCVEPGDKGHSYSLLPVFSVSDKENTREFMIDIKHFEPVPLNVTAHYVGYASKGEYIEVTHQIKSNHDLPKSLKPTTEVKGFKYNPSTGLVSYLVEVIDLDRPSSFDERFECLVDDAFNTVIVATGERWRAPSAAATYFNHYFKDGMMVYEWMFRDAIDGIPKEIRIEDYWKHNVNVTARTIDLDYDRKTGIGKVTVKADFAIGKKYFAAAAFRFPSPDPLYYPLHIDA